MAGISPEDEAEIAAVIARHPCVVAAWLFGSLARREARADSDLDLAVLLRSHPTADDRASLADLASALERWSPSGRVDLLLLGEQGPVLRHRVLREGRLLLDADRRARVDFEGRTISEYFDWKPTHDIAMRSVFAGLRERFARGSG